MKIKILEALRDLGKIATLLGVVGLVAMILLFHVWNEYRITSLGYEIAKVSHEHRRLIEENKKLSIEVAVQGRTERMTEVARDQFGLQPMKPNQVRSLSFPSTTGVLEQASLGY